MVDYPYEWVKYLIEDKVRTFKKDTPSDIVEKAKKINKSYSRSAGKNFFHFEAEENEQEESK